MDNLRGLLGIRRMDRFLNARIRKLCVVKNGLDERIDESLLRWLGHVERLDRDRIAKSLFECVLLVIQWVGCGRVGLIL